MNDDLARVRLNILTDYIPEGFIGAEIGVFKGHFSKVLLEKKPEKLFLIDPWYRLSDRWTWVKTENSSTLDAFNNILRDFDPYIRSGTVVPVVDFSRNFLMTAPKASFDFIYIDASHSYSDTFEEILLSQSLLKSDGVLLGDDWHDDPLHRHYGVAKAVKEFIENGICELLFAPIAGQWGVKFRGGQ